MRKIENPNQFQKSLALAFMVTLLTIFISGCEDSEDIAEAKISPVAISEVKIRKIHGTKIFDPLWFGGYLKAAVDYQVIAEKSGIVINKHIQPGMRVKKGQTLVSIKPSSLGLGHRNYLIKAPISGIVSQLPVELGSYLKTSQVVVSLADTRKLHLDILGSYEDSLTLAQGATVSVFLGVGTNNEREFQGKIITISPSSDPVTGLYPMRVSLNCVEQTSSKECAKLARLGSFVKVLFKKNQRLAIQLESIEFSEGRNKVFVYNKDGRAEERKVETGKVSNGKFEITSGLIMGEDLIVSYIRRPKSGEKVTVVESKEALSKATPADKTELN